MAEIWEGEREGWVGGNRAALMAETWEGESFGPAVARIFLMLEI